MDLTTGGHWLVIRQVTITLQSINIDSDDSQCEWDLIFKAPIYGRVYIPLGGRLFFFTNHWGVMGYDHMAHPCGLVYPRNWRFPLLTLLAQLG